MKKYLTILASLVLLCSANADVLTETDPSIDHPERYVKGRYFIAFEQPKYGEERIVDLPDPYLRGKTPFGEHSSGQSKEEIARTINLNGDVLSVYDALNTIYVSASHDEALRLSRDPRVLYVEQDMIDESLGTQYSPGWALDRLDESGPSSPGDNTYQYTATGAGQKIYVFDTGLDLSQSGVIAEFGTRASIIYDYNGGSGYDCQGHGSAVASAAGGATHGVAKGVSLVIVKVTILCSGSAYLSTSAAGLNWIAVNETPGTIINYSRGFHDTSCTPTYNTTLDNAFGATYTAGMLNVVAAGNDSCDTANFTPTALADNFVVGATSSPTSSYDAKAWFSRTGSNISTFSPGDSVSLMSIDGLSTITDSGTSYAAPYISGMMAVACEAAAPGCTSGNTASLYSSFKATGTMGTVTEAGGSPLIGATSRFNWQQW